MSVRGDTTQLAYATDNAGAGSVTVALVLDLTPPKYEVEDIDVTTHDSPENDAGLVVKQYTPGVVEPGQVDLVIQFAKTQHATMLALVGAEKFWKITYPDGSYDGWFPGYIKSFGKEASTKGVIMVPCTIKVSGEWTFTAAA